MKLGVGYTVVKNAFFKKLLCKQFLCIAFDLSQHKTAKVLISGPTQKCAAPSLLVSFRATFFSLFWGKSFINFQFSCYIDLLMCQDMSNGVH